MRGHKSCFLESLENLYCSRIIIPEFAIFTVLDRSLPITAHKIDGLPGASKTELLVAIAGTKCHLFQIS